MKIDWKMVLMFTIMFILGALWAKMLNYIGWYEL